MSTSYHIEDEVHQRAYDSRLMRRLLGFLRPYVRWLFGAVLLLLCASLLSNFIPLLNMRAIDRYINNPNRTALQKGLSGPDTELGAALDQDIHGLRVLLVGLCALLVAQALIRYGHSLMMAYVGQRTMFDMRMRVFEHLQKMPLHFLDKNPVGRLMTRVTNDVEKIQQTIVTGLVQVISDLFTIVVVLGFMISVNWVLALITLSTVPFVFLISFVFRKYARQSYLNIAKKIAHLNAFMQESITGMRIVQVFCQESKAYQEYRRRNAEHRDEWFRQIRNFALYFPSVEFMGSLSIGLIVLYIGGRLLHDHAVWAGHVSFGAMFAYIQWADRIYGPIRALADRYNMLLEAMASSERIFGLLDTPGEEPDPPDARLVQTPVGRVEFDHVWFAYEEGQWVLKDVTLAVEPGERLAIVGYTGAGKTTLVNLLCRFYDPQRGAIRIGGTDIRTVQRESLRRAIGIVLQDVFLFSGSVEYNIRFGAPTISDERMRQCAEFVNAARFIEQRTEKYGYDVGERGCRLSTGQRQLLAFARALAYDPGILVLDEATSSVDTETEALIQDAIQKLMEKRTCIVIAHRLSTVQHADRIVVIHHGEIRESGTHEELLALGGLYYTLYQLQYDPDAFWSESA